MSKLLREFGKTQATMFAQQILCPLIIFPELQYLVLMDEGGLSWLLNSFQPSWAHDLVNICLPRMVSQNNLGLFQVQHGRMKQSPYREDINEKIMQQPSLKQDEDEWILEYLSRWMDQAGNHWFLMILNEARENGNLQPWNRIPANRKSVRDGWEGSGQPDLTGFLLQAGQAYQVSFKDGRGPIICSGIES